GDEACERIAASIRAYAGHLGVAEKYHETVTQAWMFLVAEASQADDFETFLAYHPELLEKSLLAQYYSAETLASQAAREHFVPADLKSLPKLGRSTAGVLK